MTTTVQYEMLIGGEWHASGATFEDMNPASGEVFADISDAGPSEARTAIDSARGSQPGWASTPHPERAQVLLDTADLLQEQQQRFADALIDEAGSWFGKAMFETGYVIGLLRAAAAWAYRPIGEVLPSEHGKLMMAMREPVGIVSVISPWNFPLLLSTRAVAYALVLGNGVVLKPSEETPVSGGLLLGELFETAGLPPGVLNVVTCSRDSVAAVGEELISNPAVGAISFTGSIAVGRSVGAKGGQHLKKTALELGGNDALLVMSDADMERAVDAAAFGAFMHQGQICMSVERVLVDASIAEEFTERLTAKASGLTVGDPRQPENVIGPVINAKQLAKIAAHVDGASAEGAHVLTGGSADGLFYQPTVLSDVTPGMAVFDEETFGPVAPITTFKSEDEAVELANGVEHGLSAGIITKDEERGLAIAGRLRTGIAHVNDTSSYDEPHVPFGGAKNSGVGRHGGDASFDTFTETRWITVERGGRHYPF